METCYLCGCDVPKNLDEDDDTLLWLSFSHIYLCESCYATRREEGNRLFDQYVAPAQRRKKLEENIKKGSSQPVKPFQRQLFPDDALLALLLYLKLLEYCEERGIPSSGIRVSINGGADNDKARQIGATTELSYANGTWTCERVRSRRISLAVRQTKSKGRLVAAHYSRVQAYILIEDEALAKRLHARRVKSGLYRTRSLL